MDVVTVAGVDLWFPGGPQVLYGVDLQVKAGEHWALLGANGAGKSTLLSLAGAQRFPSRGTVRVLGHELGTVDLRELRRAIGVVDVRLRMPGDLTVAEYVATGSTQTVQLIHPPDAALNDRTARLLDRFELTPVARRSVAVCSQGERARARLARALLAEPRLLLLDEPAAGLDLPGRADLLTAMERAAGDDPQLASISVTHHLEELPGTTTHVALLRDGRLLAQGDVTLLHDTAALTECFGRPVSAFRHDDRWYAVAR
jgi:iron complex transport system ATP-binding protein